MEGEGRGGGGREGKGREIKTPLLNGLPTGLILYWFQNIERPGRVELGRVQSKTSRSGRVTSQD